MKLLVFTLPVCSHCRRALKWIDELKEENEAYRDIEIEVINERRNKKLADSYDYYLVPSIFMGETKLFEGKPTKDDMKEVLKKALRQ